MGYCCVEKSNPQSVLLSSFVAEMKKVFDHPVQGRDTAKCLLALHQGPCSVAEYSVVLRTLAVDSGWNEESLQGIFLNSLSDQVKEELVEIDKPDTLDSLISLAAWLDNHLW